MNAHWQRAICFIFDPQCAVVLLTRIWRLQPLGSCFFGDVSSLTVAAEGWKKQSSDNCCCCCHGWLWCNFFGVVCPISVAGISIIVMFWRTLFGSSCGQHCWLLTVEGVVGFLPWRKSLSSHCGGSHEPCTMEEVIALASGRLPLALCYGGRKSLALHSGGCRGLALWRQPLDLHFRELLALLSSAWGSTGLAVDWHIFL